MSDAINSARGRDNPAGTVRDLAKTSCEEKVSFDRKNRSPQSKYAHHHQLLHQLLMKALEELMGCQGNSA